MIFTEHENWRGLTRLIMIWKMTSLTFKNFMGRCALKSPWSRALGWATPRRQSKLMYGLSTSVLWRCAVIGIIPLLVWSLSEPMPITKWERAGDRHYRVWYAPGQDKACLILKLEHISPGLKPFACQN